MINIEIANQIIRTINSALKEPKDYLILDDDMIVSMKMATDNFKLIPTLEYIRDVIEFLNKDTK